MKIVIFGASGKTGSQLVDQALDKGYHVIAYMRRTGSLWQEHPNLKVIVGNLNESLRLKDAIMGADACICALGGRSLTHRSPEITEGIKLITETMEQVNVHRFIYMSSIGAGESKYYMPQPMRFIITRLLLSVPLADHNINEQQIAKSKLQWTIIRPGGLTNKSTASNFKYGSESIKLKGSPGISRANVAKFMLQQLTDTKFINKSVWLFE